MKIIYDAGHGGKDPGALGNGARECDLTLEIVLALEACTKASHPDWTVILTRDHDVYLSPGTRQRMAMASKADAFVSIHCNAVEDPKANGCEVVYREEDDFDMGILIKESIIAEFDGLKDRGMKSDLDDLKRSLSVLSTPGLPSVIVEPGFITNKKDFAALTATMTMAEAILRGIEKWSEM